MSRQLEPNTIYAVYGDSLNDIFSTHKIKKIKPDKINRVIGKIKRNDDRYLDKLIDIACTRMAQLRLPSTYEIFDIFLSANGTTYSFDGALFKTCNNYDSDVTIDDTESVDSGNLGIRRYNNNMEVDLDDLDDILNDFDLDNFDDDFDYEF